MTLETTDLFGYWVILLTTTAAVTDARQGLIPNWLTLPSLTAGPLAAAWVGGLPGLGASLVGVLVCGAIPLLLFRLGGCGGGDVKLLAALGGIAGVHAGLSIALSAFLLATFYALASLAFRGHLWTTLGRSLRLLLSPLLPRRMRGDHAVDRDAMHGVRLGPAVLCASLAVLAASQIGF